MKSSYHIERAENTDIPFLPAIERAAAVLFADDDLPQALRESVTAVDVFEEACRQNLLWVAKYGDEVVAFILLKSFPNALYIKEIDVHPAHGRKGIGRMLIDVVRSEAIARGLAQITLTTFAHLPWNGPYYERLGFETIEDKDLGQELRAVLAQEAELGMKNRIAMAQRIER